MTDIIDSTTLGAEEKAVDGTTIQEEASSSSSVSALPQQPKRKNRRKSRKQITEDELRTQILEYQSRMAKSCICDLGVVCQTMSAHFAVLNDSSSSRNNNNNGHCGKRFVELPPPQTPLRTAYCQYLCPGQDELVLTSKDDEMNKDESTNDDETIDEEKLYVAIHHFYPQVIDNYVVKKGSQNSRRHRPDADLLPFPTMAMTVEQRRACGIPEENDLKDRVVNHQLTASNNIYWITPSYPFDKVRVDLEQSTQLYLKKKRRQRRRRRSRNSSRQGSTPIKKEMGTKGGDETEGEETDDDYSLMDDDSVTSSESQATTNGDKYVDMYIQMARIRERRIRELRLSLKQSKEPPLIPENPGDCEEIMPEEESELDNKDDPFAKREAVRLGSKLLKVPPSSMFKPLEFEESKESDENLEEYADPRLEREDLALPETVELKLAAFDTAATCDDESYIKANEVRKERKHPKASDLSFCRKSMLSKILVAFSLNIMVVLGLYYSGALASEQAQVMRAAIKPIEDAVVPQVNRASAWVAQSTEQPLRTLRYQWLITYLPEFLSKARSDYPAALASFVYNDCPLYAKKMGGEIKWLGNQARRVATTSIQSLRDQAGSTTRTLGSALWKYWDPLMDDSPTTIEFERVLLVDADECDVSTSNESVCNVDGEEKKLT